MTMTLEKVRIKPGLSRRARPGEIVQHVADGRRQCQGCEGNVVIKVASPDLLPGFPDPLPIAELMPVPAGWAQRSDVRAKHIRALRWLIDNVKHAPPPAVASGDGIVIVGGGRYWSMVTISVRMCRDVCDLPIQVWHRGTQEPINREDLADIAGVTYHDATAIPSRICRGWEVKSIALLHCGFKRVLYLDADAYPVSSPAPLFALATPEKPFVFWSDLPGRDGDVKWDWVGIEPTTGQRIPTVQGGQLVIHRRAFWRELVIFYWLCQHSDYFFAHLFGDQDCYRVVLAMTGSPHLALGRAPWSGPAFVPSLDGVPAFVHRCQGKGREFGQPGIGDAPQLPGEVRASAHQQRLTGPPSTDASTVFGDIYRSGVWGHGNASGGGSTPTESRPYMQLVNGLISVAGWQRVVDLACGDGQVTRGIVAKEVIGVDCYEPHLKRLRHGAGEWLHLDIDIDRDRLPAGDVALLKDCLHHFPNALIRDWLAWASTSGKWQWIVITTDVQHPHAGDIPLGGYRPLREDTEPLKGIGCTPLSDYLHKRVWLLKCR